MATVYVVRSLCFWFLGLSCGLRVLAKFGLSRFVILFLPRFLLYGCEFMWSIYLLVFTPVGSRTGIRGPLLSLSFDKFEHVFSPLLAFRSEVWPVGDTTSSLFLFPDFAGVDFSGRSWKLLPFSAFFLASNSSKHRSSLTIACRDFTVVELERDLDSWGSRPFSRLSDSELLRS